MRGSVKLEGIVEVDGVVGNELGEKVGGEDFGERAEAYDGGFRRPYACARRGFAVAAEEDFVVADNDKNHAGGAGGGEEFLAEDVGLIE